MAFLINNTAVIDNSRQLTAITSFDSTVASTWDSVTTTAVSKTLVNREYCTATANNIIITLPSNPAPQAGSHCAVSVTTATGVSVYSFYPIQQSTGDDYLYLDIANVTVYFTYVDATRGWIIS